MAFETGNHPLGIGSEKASCKRRFPTNRSKEENPAILYPTPSPTPKEHPLTIIPILMKIAPFY
jgi:hypothetical protein